MRRSAALLLALAAAPLPDAGRLPALALLYCPGEPAWVYDRAAAQPDEAYIAFEVESARAGFYDPSQEWAPMAWRYQNFAGGPADGDEAMPGLTYADWRCGFLYVVRCRRRGVPSEAGEPYPEKYAARRHWADPRRY